MASEIRLPDSVNAALECFVKAVYDDDACALPAEEAERNLRRAIAVALLRREAKGCEFGSDRPLSGEARATSLIDEADALERDGEEKHGDR